MSDIGIPTSPGTRVNTFIDLVRRFALEVGVSKDPINQITTAVNATSDVARMVAWIVTAWRDIQDLERNWRFMRRSCSFLTIAGQSTYTYVEAGITLNTFSRWDLSTFRCYLDSSGVNGEMPMGTMDYDDWRNAYQIGSNRTVQQQPFLVTETPDLSLGLGPTPAVGYRILGDYYLSPKDLSLDTEVPALPERHNLMGIVGKAMISYGYFEGAPEVIQRGELIYRPFIAKLRRDELPPIRMGGALA